MSSPIHNMVLGMAAFYNPHPAGSGGEQTRTGYYLDYLRDATLHKYTADAVGSFVQRASAEQVKAIGQLGDRFQSVIGTQTAKLSSAIGGQTAQLTRHISQLQAATTAGFTEVNHRLGALQLSMQASNILLNNIAILLRIPDSEKQRQRHIEMGLKFLVNAQHDGDLFKDALDEFLKAENLHSQDYFVLQKIGMIYLYVPSLVNLRSAAEYLTRSGKYAGAESYTNSARSTNPLRMDPTEEDEDEEDEETGMEPSEIAKLAVESYVAASRAEYALSNLDTALQLAQKAVKICPGLPGGQLQLAKCAAASSQPAIAVSSLRIAIGIRPGIGRQAATDLDLLGTPEIPDLLAKYAGEIHLDIPFDLDASDSLRQRPIAVALQQAWQLIGKREWPVEDKWRSIVQAIRAGTANETEIRLLTLNAFPHPNLVAWGNNKDGQCNVPANLSGVVAIAMGSEHTVTLKQDGTVVAWGNNKDGQCNVPANLSGVVAIAAEQCHTVALKQDGTVVAWGYNKNDECNVPANLSGVVAIAMGFKHTMALKKGGTVVAWGFNEDGRCNVPANLSGVAAISAGRAHTVALKKGGTVVALGNNKYGQNNVPANLSGVAAIASRCGHTVALKQDGTVVAWGYNTDGQCNVPANLNSVVAIAMGSSHTVALKKGGTVVAWGENKYGQCNVPANLSGVVAIAAGASHTVARLESREITEPGSDLALQFLRISCALLAAADAKLSSHEQHWLEAHLGVGSPEELLSLITTHGPDGLQAKLQSLAKKLTPDDRHWLHCRVWQLGDFAGTDSLEEEESEAIGFILKTCGWFKLPELRRSYLLNG